MERTLAKIASETGTWTIMQVPSPRMVTRVMFHADNAEIPELVAVYSGDSAYIEALEEVLTAFRIAS